LYFVQLRIAKVNLVAGHKTPAPFHKVDEESEHSNNGSGENSTLLFKRLFSIGLDVIAGVEWSFYKNISLSAEYGIIFYYYSQTVNYNINYEYVTGTKERKGEGIELTADYINFGITVYF
ncbi:MAG: hypothetical protein MZV64_70070, partial [Ignavibacteriales bacterium]|nr:hypothetical protein [Ignavibacteriales bacterium]